MVQDPNISARTQDGRVYDATRKNWVDAYCPPWSRPWLRLSRADRPIGTWLLLMPCLWTIALAAIWTGWTWWDLWLIVGSTIGAFLMRGAGCTWNDFTDHAFDAQVSRTRSRPIPSGQVTRKQALAWAVIQSLTAFLILITFNWTAIALGVLSVGLVAIYPFAKRFTWWPQVFLGLAFNWGALLLWAAKTGDLGVAPVALYLAGIAWTLHYDTIYAHQDREDDALIGVKSTARLFEDKTPRWLWIFTAVFALFAIAAVLAAGGGFFALTGVAAMAVFMSWQTMTMDMDDPDTCLMVFRATKSGGLLFLAGLVLNSLI